MEWEWTQLLFFKTLKDSFSTDDYLKQRTPLVEIASSDVWHNQVDWMHVYNQVVSETFQPLHLSARLPQRRNFLQSRWSTLDPRTWCLALSIRYHHVSGEMRWGNEMRPSLWHPRRLYHHLLRVLPCCRIWQSGSNVVHLHVWSIAGTLDDVRETDCHLVLLVIRIHLS